MILALLLGSAIDLANPPTPAPRFYADMAGSSLVWYSVGVPEAPAWPPDSVLALTDGRDTVMATMAFATEGPPFFRKVRLPGPLSRAWRGRLHGVLAVRVFAGFPRVPSGRLRAVMVPAPK